MVNRLAYQSFGDSAYNADGSAYWQIPDEIIGDWPNALQHALRALLKAWAGKTKTDISRKEFLKLLPEEKQGKTLRTVTGWFSRLVELGVIARERIQGTNVWITTFAMPFLARLNDDKTAPAAAASPAQEPTAGFPESVKGFTNEQMARWVVDEARKLGFELVMNEHSQIRWNPLRAGAVAPADTSHPVVRGFLTYLEDIRRLLEATRPARE
jgi:hypothetical protein